MSFLYKSKGDKKPYMDYSLLFVIIFLACFGLVMIYSASYYTAQTKNGDGAFYIWKQGRILILGIILMLGISRLDYHWFARLAGFSWFVSVFLMIVTDFTMFGIERNGSKRWLGYGKHSFFQTSELVKIAIVLILAVMLTKVYRQLNQRDVILLIVAVIGIPTILVAKENLSAGIIIAGMGFGMVFVASKDVKPFIWIVGVGFLLAVIGVIATDRLVEAGILQGYQAGRIMVWLNPQGYSRYGGYQVLQGLYAIGSGGLFGKGFGNSVQKLAFLPEAQNDMIFSIICEELGFFGAFCVILLFGFMLYRFMVIANNAPDLFGSLLVIGIMAQIALQELMNIAVVTNSMPNTGISLPFISYGGTSLLFLMAEMGIVFSIARQIRMD